LYFCASKAVQKYKYWRSCCRQLSCRSLPSSSSCFASLAWVFGVSSWRPHTIVAWGLIH
jgi:hypothetical protein